MTGVEELAKQLAKDLADETTVVPAPAAAIARTAAQEFEAARRNWETVKATLVAALGYDAELVAIAGQRIDLIDGADGVMRLLVLPKDAPPVPLEDFVDDDAPGRKAK
jgi:hypothetical protein